MNGEGAIWYPLRNKTNGFSSGVSLRKCPMCSYTSLRETETERERERESVCVCVCVCVCMCVKYRIIWVAHVYFTFVVSCVCVGGGGRREKVIWYHVWNEITGFSECAIAQEYVHY